MDEVADIISAALSATSPAPASKGLSQARYILDEGAAETCRRRGAELLQKYPLYPGILG